MNQSFERGVWYYLKHPGSPCAGERERLPVCGDSGVQTKIRSDGRRKLPREENIKGDACTPVLITFLCLTAQAENRRAVC